MIRIKPILAVLAVSMLLVGITSVLPIKTTPEPASAAMSDKYDGDCTGNETAGRCADKPLAFDHSQCQYPDRWSNPANGCDNSDPAVPECIKSFSTQEGEQSCIAAFVEVQKAKDQQNIVDNAVTAPKNEAISQCGGK